MGGAVDEEDLGKWEAEGGGGGGGRGEERILVAVRMRPLNGMEIARNDPSDWECINKTTVIHRNGITDRSMYPHAYSFDRVFDCECSTRQVYKEAAKEVVLSVVSGINSSIFAYGQTSSGKTYTMTGITDCSVADIYDYIKKHKERDFVLKFSAIEIYNEVVRDLLGSDPAPLRLLDDPEKGTIIEKLTEETLRDESHLWELLSVCEAQRHIGETSLNEMSSRSHQILKLTIESSSRENFSTLAASVNFVDLAGSERASQALSAGARLKEGCHINRSLLTLGTVIRKLSKGRNAHVPYRDSKLTRILQPSLGGNARTAIICTMSPARTHIEQSRNTLLFATCAKQVATSAQVNVVMSDKALVKHLRKELARLESELRHPVSSSNPCYSEAMKEKDFRIKKMEIEIKELKQQRDLAQSRLEDLLQVVGEEDGASGDWDECSHVSATHLPNQCEDVRSVPENSSIAYQIEAFSVPRLDTPNDFNDRHDLHLPFSHEDFTETRMPTIQQANTKQIMQDYSTDFEDLCKEVRCIEMEEPNKSKNDELIVLSTDMTDEFLVPLPLDASMNADHLPEKEEDGKPFEDKPWITSGCNGIIVNDRSAQDKEGSTDPRPFSEDKPANVREIAGDTIESYSHPKENSPFLCVRDLAESKSLQLIKSSSCKASLMTIPSQSMEENDKTPPSRNLKDFPGRPEQIRRKYSTLEYNILETPKLGTSDVDSHENAKAALNEVLGDFSNSVGLKEVPRAESNRENSHNPSGSQGLERTINEDFGAQENAVKDVRMDPMQNSIQPLSCWPEEFETKRREILQLWHACSVPLVHRTYFFLLFKGDPADSIYMEVEHRRLSFLRNTLSDVCLVRIPAEDLRREREMLCRQIKKKMTVEEREGLYARWGISLHSKQRRAQLVKLLWAEPGDMVRIGESASVVAKLVGPVEPAWAMKEMFGLSFSPQLLNNKSSIRKPGFSSF